MFALAHQPSLPLLLDLEGLVPDEVIAAQRHLDEQRAAWAEASSQVAVCEASIAGAEKLDAIALGDALQHGADDPGNANTEKAKAALDEARRQLAGREQAIIAAGNELTRLLHTTDLKAVADELEQLSDEQRRQVLAMFDAARRLRDKYRVMREMAGLLRAFPGRPPVIYNEEGGWHIARTRIEEDLTALGGVRHFITDVAIMPNDAA